MVLAPAARSRTGEPPSPMRWCRARPPPPTSTEDRDPDDDPPRQSNRARQYPRNRNRRASSTLRDRAALPRSANVRSPLKDFQWWGSNCQGSIAIHRLHEPYVFLKGLVCDTERATGVRGWGLADVLLPKASSLGESCTLVYRAIWRLSRASPARRRCEPIVRGRCLSSGSAVARSWACPSKPRTLPPGQWRSTRARASRRRRLRRAGPQSDLMQGAPRAAAYALRSFPKFGAGLFSE